jgi:hypothetical protein
MNEKIVKTIVKGVLGLAFTAAIGYTVKAERKIQDRIDDYYDAKTEQDTNDQ